MNVLMKRLRVALRGEDQANKEELRELMKIGVKIAALCAAAFLVSGVSFFGVTYPCGPAVTTVMMAAGKGGIYILIPVLAGLAGAEGLGAAALGDAAACMACAGLFFAMRKKEIRFTERALAAAGVCVAVKTAVAVGTHTFYTYDGFSVLGAGMLVFFFTLLFGGLRLLITKEESGRSVPVNIFIITAAGMLLAGGILPRSLGVLMPFHAAAFLAALLTGYRLGVMEGATAGAAAGLVLFGTIDASPAVMGILVCGGMAAGLLRSEKRVYAAVFFCAVCLSFGLLKGYPNLYLSVYEPVLASLIFLCLPAAVLERADRLLAKAGRDDAYYELLEKNRILAVLDEYRETFSYLALVYGTGRDGRRSPGAHASGGCLSGGRSVAAYQFTAMACAINGMMRELKHTEHPVLLREERFRISQAKAGYARYEGVSGDSVLCSHLRHGEYLLALADGMGKGEKAAQESNLTLNTLYNLLRAGFEPELALRMINSLLLMKSTDEIFSTVDMGLIDLYTGRLRMFKIGASTTFIKRNGKVQAIKAASLPLGMVEKITVDSIEVNLRKGDQIIIVSDGITEAGRGRALAARRNMTVQAQGALSATGTEDAAALDVEQGTFGNKPAGGRMRESKTAGSRMSSKSTNGDREDWLCEAITQIKSTDPQTVADLILNQAVERCGLREKDDMTVIIAAVH